MRRLYVVLTGMALNLGPGHLARAQTFNLIHTFQGGNDGAYPQAGLIDLNGELYGTTAGGGASNRGTVFKITVGTGMEQVIYAFENGGDGAQPLANLTNVDDKLYGTTSTGGIAPGYGTLFSLSPESQTEHVLQSFEAGPEGVFPESSLLSVGTLLYGTTYGAQPAKDSDLGAVFSFDPSSRNLQVIHTFQGYSDGLHPASGLTRLGNLLFGTTSGGGRARQGTIFSINLQSNAENVVYSFQSGSDGAVPLGGLLRTHGRLYGTTQNGGSGNCHLGCGTVYFIDPKNGSENVIYSFKGGYDGANPVASLIEVNGILYGTTRSGGVTSQSPPFEGGTVFSLNPKTQTERILHSFLPSDGASQPYGSLLITQGILYGTTLMSSPNSSCGQDGCGAVYSIAP